MSALHDLVADVVSGTPQGPDGIDVLWSTLHELGLTTIGVPEEAGGSGGTAAELSEVVEALAQHGRRVPLAEAAVVSWVLAAAGHEPVRLGTPVIVDDPAGPTVLPAVPWARWASHVLLVSGDGVALADLGADGVVLDPGVDVAVAPLDRVTLPGTATTPLPDPPDPEEILARLALLRSAAMVGAARGAYALTRTHVRTRHQFGRPLVAVPAVATALATLRVQVIQAESALAIARDDSGTARRYPSAVAARVVCGGVATEVARTSHQLHGAMGITEEYALHHLTRALWADRDADLPEERWAERLGELVLDGGEDHLWSELTATRT